MFKPRFIALLVSVAVMLGACSSAEDRAATYLKRANVSFESGDLIKAELDIKNTLQIEPDNVQALVLMSKIAEQGQEWARMFNALNRVIDLDPENIDARIRLARLYVLGQRFDDAAEHVNAVLARDPGNYDARVLNATLIYRDGQAEAALEEVEAVLAEAPDNVGAITYLATYHFGSDPEKALAIVRKGLERSPNEATFQLLQFKLLEQLGRTDEIEAAYKKIVAANPDNAKLRYAMARFYIEQDRISDAEAVLKKMVDERPDDVTAKAEYARFVATRRDPAAAEALLNGYIKAQPETYEFQLLLAAMYESQDEMAKAEDVYRAIIKRDGTGQEGLKARNQIAQIKLRAEDRPAAEALIAEVIANEPSNSKALLMRSAIQFQDGDLSSAVTGLRTILRNNPTAENDDTAQRALLLLGKAHFTNGDMDLARDSFGKLVAVAPGHVEAVTSLAQILIREKNFQQARDVLRSGYARNPDDLRITRMLLESLVQTEDWKSAGELADKLVADPDSVALGRYIKGRVALAARSYDEAIEQFTASVDAQPTAVEALSGLVQAYVQADKTDAALAYLNDYNAENPDSVHGLTLTGEVYGRMRDWDKAVSFNERALKINPKWIPAYRNMVGIYFETKSHDKAVAIIRQGIENLPENLDLSLLLASAYERDEKFDEAIAIYEKILEERPDIDLAANNLAALIADHQPTEARLQLALGRTSHFRDESNPIFHDTLGWVFYRLGDYAQAVPLLERAVAGAGHLPQLRYHLGMAYYKLDRLDVAKKELQAAVDKSKGPFTGSDEAKSTLELL